jgi:nucleoid DNA-binding protein/nucleoid-associated protein YgaU
MNEKITLPTLVGMLSGKTGDTKKMSEDFIKEFFAIVSDQLQNGEQIKIKDIGVFKTVEVDARKSVNVSTGEEFTIPGHRKVVFIPSKELAAEVNSPFEMFETVELADNFSEEEAETEIDEGTEPLYEVPEEPEGDDGSFTPGTNETASETKAAEATTTEAATVEATEAATTEATTVEATEAATVEAIEAAAVEEATEETEVEAEATEAPYVREARRPRRHQFLWGMVCGMLIAALIVVVYALVAVDDWRVFCPNYSEAKAETETVVAEDSTAAVTAEETDTLMKEDIEIDETEVKEETAKEPVPTQPSDSKVYDIITTTRYLTTMAKDHYGNYHLWPYIYMENSSFLGHPDRIRPGTKVVIPPLSKYGVDPNNPKDIAKAKKKGEEIYNKYKNQTD